MSKLNFNAVDIRGKLIVLNDPDDEFTNTMQKQSREQLRQAGAIGMVVLKNASLSALGIKQVEEILEHMKKVTYATTDQESSS